MDKTNETIIIDGKTINILELKSKKGRKSKQDIILLEKIKNKQIELGIYQEEQPKIPKKKGRKPKIKNPDELDKKIPKKRGRKPKGGKIINSINILEPIQNYKTNIILHLKCNTKDLLEHSQFIGNLNYNPVVENIQAFNNDSINNVTFINNNNDNNDNININNNNIHDNTQKNIWEKLKKLQHQLKFNKITDKKSNCFWCSYEFNNLPIYIPKYFINDNYEVYGCFCTPECACAYLCNEKIDNSTKWERYSLLNSIYCSIFNYDKNIKPAPNPHYLLEKFYGNLNIDEYRQLLNNDNLLLVVDKPLTKTLPEIHYENDELPNIYNSNNNNNNNQYNSQKKYRLSRNKPAISHNNSTWTT
jgi:hypothetical protein